MGDDVFLLFSYFSLVLNFNLFIISSVKPTYFGKGGQDYDKFFDYVDSYLKTYGMTENGAVGYRSTGNDLVDILFRTSSYRNDGALLIKDITTTLSHQNEDLLKLIFYVRDIRNGLGERKFFRFALGCIFSDASNVKNKDELFIKILPLIPEFGRYDDLFIFFDSRYEESLIKFIKNQLDKDIDDMKNKKEISLLAKWLPSVNSSSKASKYLATKLIKAFGMNQKEYRKLLSSLRTYLKVIEKNMCANGWHRIDYNKVPSNANRIYKDAFMLHDPKRRQRYLADLENNAKNVKMNSSVNFPHDVLHLYKNAIFNGLMPDEKCKDAAVEQLWKNLKQVKGLDDTIVVRDDSGSMYATYNIKNGIMPYEIATALAIYCAEHLNEPFKNKIITFSSTPRYLVCDQNSLYSKYAYLFEHSEIGTTNIQGVFDLILGTALEFNLKQEELPKNILIISDMEFNQASGFNHNKTTFDFIKYVYKEHGYLLPRLIFWNVASRTNIIPVLENENGIILISGYSQNILTLFNEGDVKDVYKIVEKIINDEKYINVPKLEF
mgnify:CR=1 FL=1